MEKLDYKKKFKELYQPKTTPSVIEVPKMTMIQVDGRGNPNEQDGEYQKAVELLYALSYTIKMSHKNGNPPKDYFEYVVAPLEGLWWLDGDEKGDFSTKSKFCWTSMIRQPEFVTPEVFEFALKAVAVKKPELDVRGARLVEFNEGLCVQCMHIGSFDEEKSTIEKIDQFTQQSGLVCDISSARRHHEIYLSDPRKADIAKIKTILRHPVRR